MSDVAERVKKLVVEHLGVDADNVVDNANFIYDLGADSLDAVELVMTFEEEFGVEIPNDVAETIVTVGDAINFLSQNTLTYQRLDDSEKADFRIVARSIYLAKQNYSDDDENALSDVYLRLEKNG